MVAIDRDLRSEEILGQTVTDDKGCYQIQHAVASADLILRALGPKGEELAAEAISSSATGPNSYFAKVNNLLKSDQARHYASDPHTENTV